MDLSLKENDKQQIEYFYLHLKGLNKSFQNKLVNEMIAYFGVYCDMKHINNIISFVGFCKCGLSLLGSDNELCQFCNVCRDCDWRAKTWILDSNIDYYENELV